MDFGHGCPMDGAGSVIPPAGYPNLREGQVAGPGAFRRKSCYPNREQLPERVTVHGYPKNVVYYLP